MKKIIYIHNVLPSTITSRKSIEMIRQEIASASHSIVIIDFVHIDFISLPFANELIHFIADNCISAVFRNTNAVITEMLTVVQKNNKRSDSSFHHIAITPFQNQKEFNQFLSLI